MFKVVVAHSNDPDSVEAVAEILEQCLESLAGETPQAGILFAACDFDHSLMVMKILPFLIFFDYEQLVSLHNLKLLIILLLIFQFRQCLHIRLHVYFRMIVS